MGKKIVLKIDDLSIWSENPRHIEETENQKLSENDVINILVGVVGYKYMFNLAQDIFQKGLLGNTVPVVVRTNGKYLVYDGNRRISSIKIMLNSNILDEDNKQLKVLIDKMIEEDVNANDHLQALKTIEVYSTTKEDALEIMDKTHSGIQDGVGTIPWDAYQRDKANSKRNIIDYPNAFKVVTKLKLKKKDIEGEYTTYERIFGNTKFKALFNIDDYETIDIKYLSDIYNLLCRYRKEVYTKSAGLSRIFNKVNEECEKFYTWALPRLTPEKYITLRFPNKYLELYRGQVLKDELLDYEILDYDNNKLDVKDALVLKSFVSPEGISRNQIDTNMVGEWHYVVSYKNSKAELKIFIKDLIDPVITLKTAEKQICEKESIVNLRQYILFATNSINENIINRIIISSDDSFLSGDSFLNTNTLGLHRIIFSYIDPYSSKQITESLLIKVQKSFTSLTTEVEHPDLLSFDAPIDTSKYLGDLNWPIRKLIKEINSLPLDDYHFVISSSLRSLFALIYSYFCAQSNQILKDNLDAQVSHICGALVDDLKNNHIIKNKETWIDEDAIVDIFRSLKSNKQWFIDVLNCGAHSSAQNLTGTEISSAAKKIAQLIMYISILFYKEK